MNRRIFRPWPVALLLPLLLLGAAQETAKGQRVCVCGHSFHVMIANPLKEIALAAGMAGHETAAVASLGGSTVQQHWDLADDKNKAKQAIRAGNLDVLTLSPNPRVPDEAIGRFADLLLEHNPGGRIYVQASWYPFDGPHPAGTKFTNAQRDGADLADLRKRYGTWVEPLSRQIRGVNERLAEKAKRQVVFLVPVGHAVYTLRERVAQGAVPGIAKPSDLFTDDIGHVKPAVSALAAYCYFAAIYGRSPVGLPEPEPLKRAGLGENAAAVNRLLQEIAWEAVLQEPLSGRSKDR